MFRSRTPAPASASRRRDLGEPAKGARGPRFHYAPGRVGQDPDSPRREGNGIRRLVSRLFARANWTGTIGSFSVIFGPGVVQFYGVAPPDLVGQPPPQPSKARPEIPGAVFSASSSLGCDWLSVHWEGREFH